MHGTHPPDVANPPCPTSGRADFSSADSFFSENAAKRQQKRGKEEPEDAEQRADLPKQMQRQPLIAPYVPSKQQVDDAAYYKFHPCDSRRAA